MNPDIRPRIQLTAEQKALKDKMLKEVKGSSYKAVSFKMTGTRAELLSARYTI